MILDFNSHKLILDREDLYLYNIETIEKNIKRYQEFIMEFVVNKTIDEIINTELFQGALWDNGTNDVNNLVMLYNIIAENGIAGKQYPRTDKKTFIRQMKLRGFMVQQTRLAISPGKYTNVFRLVRKESLWS